MNHDSHTQLITSLIEELADAGHDRYEIETRVLLRLWKIRKQRAGDVKWLCDLIEPFA